MRTLGLCLMGFGLMACGENNETEAGNNAALAAQVQQLRADLVALSGECVTGTEQAEQNKRMERLEEMAAEQRGGLSALQSDVDRATSDMDTIRANIIDTNTTWLVGRSSVAMYSDLFEVMEALRAVQIRPGAILTIRVEDGAYQSDQTLTLNHPDGARIEIIGNEAYPERVVLSFLNSETPVRIGIEVGEGNHLGLLSGFTVSGYDSTLYGIMVWGHSQMDVDNLVVEHFANTGVWLGWGGLLWSERKGGLETAYNGSTGMMVATTSFAHTQGLYSHDNGTGVVVTQGSNAHMPYSVVEDNDSTGLVVNYGSSVRADDSRLDNNGGHGLDLTGGSSGQVDHMSATGNDANGYQVGNGSYANLSSASSTQNGNYGYHVYYGGIVRAVSSTSTNDEDGGWNVAIQSWIDARQTTYVGNATAYNVGTTINDRGDFITR
jgi:hypothetical protein